MSGGDPTSIEARGVVPPPGRRASALSPGAPAGTLIHRKRAGAGQPAALRQIAPGRCQYPVPPSVSCEQPAPRARRGCAFSDAERQDFWRAVATGDIRLSATEDRLVWDLRAAHWRWDYIARHILARRARIAKTMEHLRALAARARYRRMRRRVLGEKA